MGDGGSKRSWRRVAWYGTLLAVPTGLTAIAVLLCSGSRPSLPPLPVPNGHDELVRAGRMIVGNTPDVTKADVKELRGFVDSNRDAMARARGMLGGACRVPLSYSEGSWDAIVAYVGEVRQVGRLFVAAGTLAEKEGRRQDALRHDLDAILLGSKSAYGGLLIHEEAGLAIQDQGLRGLEALCESLSPPECRLLIENLEVLERHQEPPASVIARDRAWYRAAAPWRIRLGIALNAKTLDKLRLPAEKALEVASKRNVLRMRRIRTLAAIRLYQSDHGGAEPPGLSALVPRYLASVPRDPSSGVPFVFRDEPGEGYRIDPAGPEPRPADATTPPR